MSYKKLIYKKLILEKSETHVYMKDIGNSTPSRLLVSLISLQKEKEDNRKRTKK